ncbi:MAG: FAA hydrolase family protein [Cytophagales bacterium]|nr:MAG: FAA hydrolase family protein [Cytophagales bacterium]
MKIFGVGRNYADHAKELGNEIPDEPIIFTKPETAVLKNDAPFYYPTFSQDIHFEVELLIRISKEGKNISPRFANKYFNEIGIGIDFTARDLQTIAKKKGLPWDIAKGFNGSAPLSLFVPLAQFPEDKNINFSIYQNKELKQVGNSKQMIFDFSYLVAYISKYFTLKKGDVIFTGTPSGVGSIAVGDLLEAYIEGQKMLICEIK